jgi:hypothetical protein
MGRKSVFKKSELMVHDIPYLPELSIDNNWDFAVQVKGFLAFIPDQWNTAKKVERKFFWAILSTLAYPWVELLVQKCREIRMEAKLTKQSMVKSNFTVPQQWANSLLNQPFQSTNSKSIIDFAYLPKHPFRIWTNEEHSVQERRHQAKTAGEQAVTCSTRHPPERHPRE